MSYGYIILVHPAPEVFMDIDLLIGGLVSFGGVYMVYRTNVRHGEAPWFFQFLAPLTAMAAFVINAGIAYLLANRGGFLFDNGSPEAGCKQELSCRGGQG